MAFPGLIPLLLLVSPLKPSEPQDQPIHSPLCGPKSQTCTVWSVYFAFLMLVSNLPLAGSLPGLLP
jgi:hypothetical protein